MLQSMSVSLLLVIFSHVESEMTRLFDQSPSIATRESTSHLLAVAERHRTSLRDIPSNPANLTEVAIQHGQISQAWMCLYA